MTPENGVDDTPMCPPGTPLSKAFPGPELSVNPQNISVLALLESLTRSRALLSMQAYTMMQEMAHAGLEGL